MLCNKCTDNPTSIQNVLDCKFCKDDGTANEIPKHLPPEHALLEACQLKPALLNRFQATKEETADLDRFQHAAAPAKEKRAYKPRGAKAAKKR